MLNPKLETQLKLLLDIFLETKLKLLQNIFIETKLKLLQNIFIETQLKLVQNLFRSRASKTRSPASTGISAAKLASPSVTAAPWTSQATR